MPFATSANKPSGPLFQPPFYNVSTEGDPNISSQEIEHSTNQEAPVVGDSSAPAHFMQQRRSGRAHKIPTYLQDYVCCGSVQENEHFCLSTV